MKLQETPQPKALSCGAVTSGKGLSLLSLPDEVLLKILSLLPLAEPVNALPLVCKGVCRLLRLPHFHFDSGVRFLEPSVVLAQKPTPVDGGAAFKWLQPRLRQLSEFDQLLDFELAPAERPFVPPICDILPTSLTTLGLIRLVQTLDMRVQQPQPRCPAHV